MSRIKRALLDDAGSATVTATGIITAVVSLALVVAAAGAHTAHSHRVRVAADLAAVAGAQALYSGAEACLWAETTASHNGAQLRSCELRDGDIIVEVRRGTTDAAARAGP